MSIQLKYRAWDKEANIMVYSDHRTRKLYDVYYDFEMNSKGELECNWEGDFTESHVLDSGILDNIMQYTGLKDKNGKEIYEGDILDYPSHWRWYVGFEDGCFRRIPINIVQRLSWEHYTLSQNSMECWEVIGNIYENPELLESEE